MAVQGRGECEGMSVVFVLFCLYCHIALTFVFIFYYSIFIY